MSYSIEPADGYIVTKVVGPVTRELAFGHVTEAHALGDQLGIRCFLFDLTEARNVESMLNNFKMTHEDAMKMPLSYRTACVAVLVDPADDSHDFTEVLAQNAGMNVTLFRERDKAIKHLEEAAEQMGR